MRAPLLALVLVAGCRFDPAGLEGGAIDGGADPIDAARPLEIGLGDGSDGAGDVDADGPLDAYTHLTADADAGSTRLVVYDTTGFEADDVVLVHQVAGVDPATQTSGDQTPLDLRDDPSGAGNWELARVAAATGTRLDLTQPLSRAYRAQLSQVVRVPQYTDLRIRGAATVTAPAYAQSGGVIAILATGEIRIDGAIDATAVGFPGGAPAVDPVGTYGCTLRDGDEAAGGGAPKGTGLVVGAAAVAGWGNVGSGGGGGDCHNAGGGGGAGAGQGGRGGGTWVENAPYGGRGGAPVTYDPRQLLVLGGGGGAGEDNADGTDGGSGGARGGGVVLLRATRIYGGGAIHADGGASADSTKDGSGGGGGGGTLLLEADAEIDVATVTARGGAGGRSSESGSGGGGGGGRARVDAPTVTSTADVGGGAGGNRANAGLPGQAGLVTP